MESQHASVEMCSGLNYKKPCEFEFDEKISEMVCIHCGKVGRRVLFTGQAKVYEHGDESKLNADNGKHLSGPETTLSSEAYSSNRGGLSAGYTAADRTKIGVVQPSKTKNKKIQGYRRQLLDYCRKINLNGKTQDECLKLFDDIVFDSKNTICKTQSIQILMGVIFHGCRRCCFPVTVKDLAVKTGESKNNVRNGLKIVEKKCRGSMVKITNTSSSLIEEYCRRLGMKKPFIFRFVSNAHIVDNKIHEYLIGKKPSTVAATAIYLTLEWFYSGSRELSDQTIAKTVEISIDTLNKSIKIVKEEMKTAGITSECIVKEANSLCH